MAVSNRAWIVSVQAGLVALVGGACVAQAQTAGVIRGTVIDSASRQPIVNAQVLVGGTPRGQSDASGRFVVRNVAAGTVAVRVQRIGFVPETRQVTLTTGGSAEVAFVLRAQAAQLTDVVVVGYGTRSRAEVSTATAQVQGEEVRNQPVAGVDAALQGRAPGVQVTQNAGNPGNGITVRVRGASSISANNQPLYVVDGVPLTQDNQSQIGFGGQSLTGVTGLNPDEIDRIDVLKDAAAAAIYGSRASNGVILITTKRGRSGAPRFSFNSYYGRQNATRQIDLLSGPEFVDFISEAYRNDKLASPVTPGVDTVNTDWQAAVLRQAAVSNINLSAQGSGDRYSYLISGSRFGQDGIVIGSGYNRGNGRVNVDFTATPKLTFRSSLALSREHWDRTRNDNTIEGVFANGLANLPYVPMFKPQSDPTAPREYSTSDEGLTYVNPLLIATLNQTPANALRFLGNVESTYEPTARVRVTGRLGSDIYSLNEREYQSARVIDASSAGLGGVARQGNTSTTKYMGEAFADIDALRTGSQKLTVTAGASSEFNRTELLYLEGQGFPSDAFQYPGSASKVSTYDGRATQANLLSAFSRANYSLYGRYLLTASLRTDGSSRFGRDRRWGVFPAVSAGWNLSDEPALAALRRVGTAKVRASYGVTGNQSIPTLVGFLTSYARANYAGSAGISPNALGNPDLRWESTREADIGLDLGFFNGRVTVVADYYVKNTNDLLVQRPVSTTSGFQNIWDNVGSVRNQGAELQLTTVNVRSGARDGFTWNTDLNVSSNRNRVTSLYRNEPFGAGLGGGINYVTVGQPIGVFYTLKFNGVDPQTGNAIYEDVNGDNRTTAADRMIVGSPHPQYFGGLRNAVSWKGFDLNAFFQFAQGQKVFNLFRQYADDGGLNDTDNKLAIVKRRWQKPGDITDVPRASVTNSSNAYRISSRYIEDGSYVRLQDVTLGYRLPRELVGRGMSDARIFVTGNNLKLWSKYLGYDPDVNSNGSNTNTALGTDFYAYPRARSVSVGLSGNF
jgi:TonB-linked SusC/RagA family outer membrane protein